MDIPDPETPSGDESTATGGVLAGVNKRKAAIGLGVVVVVAILLWRLRSDDAAAGDAGGEDAVEIDDEIQEAFEDADDPEEVEEYVDVPLDPDSELEKDAAIIDHLKDTGQLEVDG